MATRKPTTTNTRFTPQTIHEFNPETLYDADIRGLHKLIQPAQILEKKVRYLKPSIPQIPYLINFLIEGFKDLFLTHDELEKMNRNQLFLAVLEFVVKHTTEIEKGTDEAAIQQAQEILGSAFGSRAAIVYLFPVMQQCFPDLVLSHLTNEAFFACFNLIFEDTFNSPDNEE